MAVPTTTFRGGRSALESDVALMRSLLGFCFRCPSNQSANRVRSLAMSGQP